MIIDKDEKFDCHGWSRTDKDCSILIGRIPGRKQMALYLNSKSKCVTIPLAYFRSDRHAEKALEVFDDLIPTMGPRLQAGLPDDQKQDKS